MRQKNTVFQNRKENKLYFLILLIGLLLFYSSELFGEFPDLEETPLGFYTRSSRPTISPKKLPKKYLLKTTPVKNQDPLGTCTSFAASACGEHYHRKLFSEGEFTVLAETHLPPSAGGDCKPGLYLGHALNVAQKYGFVDEQRLPYESYLSYVAQKNNIDPRSKDWKNKLRRDDQPIICKKVNARTSPKTAYNATMIEIGADLQLLGTSEDYGYLLPRTSVIHHISKKCLGHTLLGEQTQEPCIGIPAQADIEWVKYELAKSHPVAMAVSVFEGCWTTSTISMPNVRSKYIGSHAVVLTGFDDITKRFTLKNSWGEKWGKFGFGDISYDYVKLYSTELVAVGR
ncbi:MAG: C1 family peptidase [Alphaproteobacteria bacterium]|nr:C1 family peptidase [Alphaproteobacteria bacterium]MBP9776391.1 C1 family peptidase [Alphaproteobacteria bacterium]